MRPYSARASWDLPVQVGDTLPDATLFEGDPHTKVKIKDLFKGKKGKPVDLPATGGSCCI